MLLVYITFPSIMSSFPSLENKRNTSFIHRWTDFVIKESRIYTDVFLLMTAAAALEDDSSAHSYAINFTRAASQASLRCTIGWHDTACCYPSYARFARETKTCQNHASLTIFKHPF